MDDAEPLVVSMRVFECLLERKIGRLEVVVAELGENDEGIRTLHADRQSARALSSSLLPCPGNPAGL